MVQRLTYRRRLSYNTRSNRVKVVKTPGGRLVYHYRKKPRRVPRCADTGKKLTGIRSARPHEKRRMKKKYKTVNRTYGGVLCHSAVRQRIIRAFLVEEQKIVRRVLKAQQASAAARK